MCMYYCTVSSLSVRSLAICCLNFRMHFLRNKDREAHRDNYPVLYYPEMYLLDGGYKVCC